MPLRQIARRDVEREHTRCEAAGARRFVDDIIEPSETRRYLVMALEALTAKRELRPLKRRSGVAAKPDGGAARKKRKAEHPKPKRDYDRGSKKRKMKKMARGTAKR